ncbi:MAG: glycosyltransferase family 4 protein [Sandaracinaceae bacterium]|nr:glycosyltransferase family 4 protein [Sandaracinaceae bacterium]
MRIGLLTTSYPRHEDDLAGIFVRGFARALASQGHAVEVLAPEPLEDRPPLEDEGVSVRFVPYARPRGLARTFYGAGVPRQRAARSAGVAGPPHLPAPARARRAGSPRGLRRAREPLGAPPARWRRAPSAAIARTSRSCTRRTCTSCGACPSARAGLARSAAAPRSCSSRPPRCAPSCSRGSPPSFAPTSRAAPT